MEKWNCENCNFQTYSILVFYKHHCKPWELKTKTRAEDSNTTPFDCANFLQLYKCTNCDFYTNLKILLEGHVKQVHNDQALRDSSIVTASSKSYFCERCDFQTCSLLVLYKHARKHVCTLVRNIRNEKTEWFHCEHCHFKCKWQSSLDTHLRVIHSVGKWYRCEHSKSCIFKTLWKPSLKTHLRMRHSVRDQYLCKYCKCTFARKMYLKSHLLKEHPENDKWLHCEHCGFKTIWTHNFMSHVKNKHPENDKWLHCEHCGFKTIGTYNLTSHVKNKHGTWFECEYCRSKFERILQLKRHIELQHTMTPLARSIRNERTTRWFQCGHCKFKSKYKRSLERHLIMHSEKWFYCEDCDFKTKRKDSLTLHWKHVHGIKTCFKCKHLKHPLGLDFKCGHRESKFEQKLQLLKGHIEKQHSVSKEKWYQCYYCKYATKDLSYIRRHLLRKHSNNDQCERCNYKIELKSTFIRHLRLEHSKCTYCEQVFLLKSQLRKHVVDQHAIAFHCQHCSHKAEFANSLDRHMLDIHKDHQVIIIMGYKCEQCENKLKADLERHILEVHSNRERHTLEVHSNRERHVIEVHSNKERHELEVHSNRERHVLKVDSNRVKPVLQCDTYYQKINWFKCEHCENKFLLDIDLQEHVLQVHSSKAEKLVHRDQCEDKIPYLSILKEHAYSKQPFSYISSPISRRRNVDVKTLR